MLNMRQYIDNLRKEAETSLRMLYALMQFRHSITCEECIAKINENAHFWLIYERSVRTNLFIGIRRLFENKNTTFNFHKFIELCLNDIQSFSKEAVRERKIKGSANANEWIDDFMCGVYEPSQDDFKSLSRLVRQNSKKMKGVYSTVASEVFAHAIHTNHSTIYEMMKDMDFEEIETSLNSIWHVYEQIWQMYENGSQPNIEIKPYPYKQEVFDSVIKQVGCKC